MSKIRVLDSNTINKIAAGEVVERPASCVKELVENSIDAGATHVEVEIISGGKSLIRVTDDGCGMSREDATLALRRHATSKLSSVKDLLSISTLGFRGEAVPTIASVSKFTLQTRRTEDEIGIQLKIEGGKIIDTHETGCKIGTTILVEDLFFNTPARLKFLKSTNTEANKIHEYLVKLALSRPEIAFKLIRDNKPALSTPGSGSVLDAISSVHGTELTNALVEVKIELEDFHLSGFISKPNIPRNFRNAQTLVINGRVISNRTITKAVEESYTALIPNAAFPFVLLKIDVPQSSIDVNVHPQKTEIKFEDEGKIFKLVYRAVREALSEKPADDSSNLAEVAATPEEPRLEPLDLTDFFGEPKKSELKNFSVEKAREIIKPRELSAETIDISAAEVSVPPVKEIQSPVEKLELPPAEKTEPPVEKPREIPKPPPEKLQPLGQVALCYIVARGGDNLYIIDQHAAHERILFDRLSAYAGQIPAQGLLIHRALKFDAREAAFIEKNLALFHDLGLTMELSGENEFRLVEVPADASEADPEIIVREIIASLPEIDDTTFSSADIAAHIRKNFLAVTACRAAIKAGQELNFRQMEILLDNLSRTPHPHTCPHGRPTIIKFTSGDLAKMFKRT